MRPKRIVYYGPEPKGWLPAEVLRTSILRRTDDEVEFRDISHFHVDLPVKMGGSMLFHRWFIPFFQDYQGLALYIDANGVVLEDIEKLFQLDRHGKPALACPVTNPPDTGAFYTNVMLLDCEKLTHWNPVEWSLLAHDNPEMYTKMMWALPGAPNHADFGILDADWNRFDEATPGTKIIQYPHADKQPWKFSGHPYKEPFLRELAFAVKSGAIASGSIFSEIKARHVYPLLIDDMMKYGE